MTPAEVAAKLRAFNEWRRGDEDIPQPDPRVIGEAIDAAVEMIDRLEAAEKSDAESIAMRRKARDERDALRAENAGLVDDMNLLRDNNTALRARIEEMEKQESVATVIKEGDSRYWMSERLWTFPNGKYPLYALPGAQGEEEEE